MAQKGEGAKVIKAGLGYTIGNYMLKGLAFFSIPIFSRLMSTRDYGQYNTFAAYESIVFVIIGLALHSSFKNAKYKYTHNFDKYISNCITLGLISFSIWCLTTNIFYSYFAEMIRFSRFIVNLLLICSMGSAIIQYFNVYVSIDYQYKKFLTISAINAISSIILSVLLICSVFKNITYVGRILGTSIPLFIISSYIIILFYKNERPVLNKEYTKYALRFSVPIIPHGISQVILSQFDRIMIRSIVGAAEAGIYSFSYNIYTIIQVTASSLDNVWGPWLYEKINKSDYIAIKKVSSDYMTGMMIFSGCILFVSPEVIKLLSPEPYWDSIYSVIPIVIGGYFSFMYTLPVQIEYYYEKTNFIAIGTCTAAVINMILNAMFIPRFGYIAAAYTTLFTYLLYYIFHFLLAYFFSKQNMFSIKIIALNIVGICCIGCITMLLLDAILVRWILAIILFVVAITQADRKYQIIKGIKNKLLKT